jgi:molybdate transport system substrate-binding protein
MRFRRANAGAIVVFATITPSPSAAEREVHYMTTEIRLPFRDRSLGSDDRAVGSAGAVSDGYHDGRIGGAPPRPAGRSRCLRLAPSGARAIHMPWWRWLIVALLAWLPCTAFAGEVRVAVATNFAEPMAVLAARFAEATGDRVVPVFGSTGKHYAQIKHGAPFAAFLAADIERPARLEADGAAVAGSRFTYALGRVVLWSPRAGYVDAHGRVLGDGDYHHLAIANPTLAPYGRAAQEVLQARGLWDTLAGRLVRGEDIGQAFHFVESGNAELGFVAYSQVKRPGHAPQGSLWEVPQRLYRAIEQQAVLLQDDATARAFLTFLRGPEARAIIADYGYGLP